jgi:hypothetical protein
MKILGYIALAFIIYAGTWFWVCSLIDYFCRRWWAHRAAYRKIMEDKVSDLLSEYKN